MYFSIVYMRSEGISPSYLVPRDGGHVTRLRECYNALFVG